MTKRFYCFLCLIGCTALAWGQGYRIEAGISGGASFYMGDANARTLFKNTHPAFGLVAHYNLNKRFSLKADAVLATISGSTQEQVEEYPNATALRFQSRPIDACMQLEFNFYEYGAPEYLPGASRISPYVSAGIGMISYRTDRPEMTACIPFGIGLRCKLPGRFNLNMEWSYRMSFSDRLDYTETGASFQLDDPWIASSAWNKNKDGYSYFNISITYDLFYIGSNCFK